jgi:AraC-like DNA-binding protein/tetratricopeptide (TPR) repeat protein
MSSSSPLLPRGVRRGIDAMRANVERNWNAVDLAAVAGVSSRTLQRQFRSFLGKVPRAVLRDVRLECARRELLQGPPDTKVMDVALRCGFPHFGRFSSEYRRRYSETPSQTLKRQAVFIDGLASMPSLLASGRDRPTVAVCPFEADPENRALARSIADELATALTRSGASVASEARSARYHLTGIMRGPAGQARLTLRLIETETSRHLWAHRADGALGDGDSAAEEHLAMRVAAALRPCMLLAEIDRATRKPDSDLSPHDLTLRAMPGVLSLDAEGNARALELLERATDRDPDHALALALAAWAYVQRVVYHFAARSTPARRGPGAAAGGSTCTRETPSRRSSGSIALDLAPHDSLAFNNMVGIGCAHFAAGRYLDAARWQERALIEHPSAIWIHRTLCPAFLLGGAEAEARRSVTALREQYPELTVSDVRQRLPPFAQTFCDLVADSLHTVGLPP